MRYLLNEPDKNEELISAEELLKDIKQAERDYKEGKVLKVGSAFLTMVALGDNGRPAEVPRLILKTSDEKLKSGRALARRRKRIEST